MKRNIHPYIWRRLQCQFSFCGFLPSVLTGLVIRFLPSVSRHYRLFIFHALFLVAFVFHSCHQQPKTSVKIDRMEKTLFTIPIDSIPASIPRLEQQYGELLDLYSRSIIRIGTPEDPEYPDELTGFLTDSFMNLAYKRVMEVYPNLKDIETGLSKAFTNYRKEFPDRIVPSVYTLISGFNESIIVTDTILAIALDKYLGNNEEMYFRMNLHSYLRQVMDRKYLIADCMKFWLTTEFPYNDSINNVLTNILYEGKIMYTLHRFLPSMPDSLMFGYTSGQMRWCRNNTAQMWRELVDKKMLYSTDLRTINKLIGPAPYCSFFTHESPGRAVIWLGYSIVASYMKNNKLSLEALLEDDDYQKILREARFKPK